MGLLAVLEAATADIERVVAGLEPERLSGEDAAAVVEVFARAKRLGAAGEALAARRVAAATAAIETAQRMGELAEVDRAYRAGRLSEVQARAIAGSAPADPAAQAELLGVAASQGVKGRRDACAAVVTDGVDVYNVAHLGRSITAHHRTALEVRDPECDVPGCHLDHHLEIDHVDGWSATKITKLDRLTRPCKFHHHQKTYDGYRLEGRPGDWRWLHPDGTPVRE